MNEPDPRPTDEQLAALLAATEKDAPPVDRAFLEQLRERSRAAFEAAAPATPSTPSTPTTAPSPKERHMSPFRWLAATAAALLVIGLVTAYWIATQKPAPDPQPENKFVIEDKLADDGRIGKVTDAQGVVAVKPVLAERWSPVQPHLVLKPGDWVRTDARGANAVALKLATAAQVIVGPHSVVELVKADEIRLLEGELEVTASDAAPVELFGPDKQKVTVKGRQHYAITKDKLVRVEKEPRWLQGFKGTTANESVGSLITKVDGRDVPLTVGYHHVNVEIRDQISRTTIEESFVNTTDAVLEGVFHFPLPQDASISGFGMWIGNQLVEADVVEKQRAREIYEEILRERRDPGLLEWAGGNIFKARVYPIPARSEKRIKITYTQVLPLRGNRYRYSYALQSELLKKHPLRELKIDVKVNSAVALRSVSSPTHPARIAKTEHSGHAEFAAQEYTPTRDFEAVFEVEPGRPDIVVVPHRRGDDGYFMVQLTPPGAAADWERPLVPNGAPLKLLVVADTSASMDKTQRANQAAVLGALLGALTPKDTINLAACDVNCDWVFEKPVPATPANVAATQTFLAKRSSLGWTDLDKAFAAALKMTEQGTHVVYLGDAISTTGNADPTAFAQRLNRLYEGKSGTFHAVALGSSYEPAALKAIGSLGGGSVRRVSAERNPQATALDLLTEIASPALRDLKVEFVGLRTARVYPEVLPNVPAGTQQILMGRYLPEGKDQSGEIVVTGTLGGKPVRYTSKVQLRDADQGNSFVPRLWARMHLDKLLEQGRTEIVKQDVIALSEEFNIITPYTSLLVLESDADRARFAVKRRFQMRDGEKFFADGRDNAAFELKQKQMKLAGEYRTALRRNVLAQLSSLGRDPSLFRHRPRWERNGYDVADLRLSDEVSADSELYFDGAYRYKDAKELFVATPASATEVAAPEPFQLARDGGDVLERFEPKPGAAEPGPDDLTPLPGLKGGGFGERGVDGVDLSNNDLGYFDDLRADKRLKDELYEYGEYGVPLGRSRSLVMLEHPATARPYNYRRRGPQLRWLGALFPTPTAPARAPKEPKDPWPAQALALSRSLQRAEKLNQLKGGIVITRQSDSFNAVRGELGSRTQRLELVSPGAWLTRTAPDGGQVLVSWCDAKECGTYSTAFQLGRVRASNKDDLKQPPVELQDNSLTGLHVAHAHMIPTVEAAGKDRALLVLKYKDSPGYEIRYLIDTARRVVLSVESRNKNNVYGRTRFSDFVEVGGQWWARKVETLDEKERRTSLTTQTVTEITAEEFAKRTAQELAGKGKVQFLAYPLPSVTDAKTRAAEGKATFDDRVVLTLHFAATQQWSRALEHLQEAEKLAAGKAGARWLRDSFLYASRRHDELRTRLLAEAAALVGTKDADTKANEYFLAEHLFGYAGQVLQTNEQLALNDALRPVYERQPGHVEGVKTWRTRQAALVERAGDADKARALAKELATDYPRDHSLQHRYAQLLAGSGDYEAAYAWLDRVLVPTAKWDYPYHEESLRELCANLLRQQGRFRDLANYLAAWIKAKPESEAPFAPYLSALVRSNQAAKAEELASQWMREAQIDGELPAPVSARLRAAVSFALGQGYDLYTNRVEERWHAPLAEVAKFFAFREDQNSLASNILYSSRFSNTDVARALRKQLAARLVKEIGTLPVERVQSLMSWVWVHDGTENGAWETIAAALRKRWDAEKDPEVKHRLGEPLAHVLSWLSTDERLKFYRVQFKDGPAAHRTEYAHRLFDELLSSPWTAEVEDELFALLDKLPTPDEPANGLYTRVATLYRLTDSLPEARFRALMKTVERPDKLTRAELHKKEEEHRKAAREGYADRLRKEAAKQPKPLANWITAERVWLDVTLERNLNEAADDCWAVLDVPAVKPDPEAPLMAHLDEVLRERAFAVLENLAARKGADAALIERLIKYVDRQAKDHPETPRWKAEKYQLLVALDRTKQLEAELTQWAGERGADTRWRVALGYLLAEQGKVPEAIKQFEAVESADELTPAAYRSLAGWYLVENRRADHERAKAASYKTTDENQLANWINQKLSPWRSSSGPLPTKFDPEALNVFKVLFGKSSAPQNHLWALQQFYQASHEPQLLSMLADGVVGHTAAKVYPFLAGMGGVLGEVRDEDTVDRIVTRIGEVRKSAKTPIDLRALDLLELLVERRAAELQNQPGPHADKALAALTSAFKREWSPGEPRLMADFLAGLGAVPPPALAKEQLRQLDALHAGAAPGSFDRLAIAHRYADTLRAHGRRGEAVDQLQAALKEFEDANKGVLPTSANGAVGALVGWHEDAGHYDRAETFLLTQLKHPIHAEQKRWLAQRLNRVYHRALAHGARVSPGEGGALYKALEARLFAELTDPDQNHRENAFEQLMRLYRTAHDLKLAGATDDLKTFAFQRLPKVLDEQTLHYESIVSEAAQTVRDLIGPRDTLAFILDRAEDEPDWVRYTNQAAWSRHGYRIGQYRAEVKELGALEPRLLNFVLTELRRDLRSRDSRTRTVYDRRHGYFWAEKADAFAKVAEEVLAEQKGSGPAAECVAEYLFHGLQREKRAIEVLLAAYEQKLLSESGRWQLADYLHREKRFAESVPVLLALVADRPENVAYRTKLMHAYSRTGKQPELLALLKATDAFFHEKDRWTEGALAALAHSCLENRLFAQSVAYYEELIPRRQRGTARHGSGDGTLSGYYTYAARAYAGLGDTKKAVDRASGAVVTWGPHYEQRKQALAALVEVLVEAPDLAGFVAWLDKEPLQSAVVRKAVGKAYTRKNDHARAVAQLLQAAELQPADAETYELLLASYDKIGDQAGAVQQLLSAVETSPREIKLFEQLGRRYAELNQPTESERAFTSIVEVIPNESEGHTLLAEVREKQGRWAEAIAHWERVAEIRALEPTGLLKTAAAQIEAKSYADAAKTLKKLRGQAWPPRFNELDKQTRELEKKLDERSKK